MYISGGSVNGFGQANGCPSLAELESRIREHRERFRYESGDRDSQIGCIQIVNPVFFPEARWIQQPRGLPLHGQRPKAYDLERAEGERIWNACLAAAGELSPPRVLGRMREDDSDRYGEPVPTRPRHVLSNGLLPRADLHRLFDKGCLTIRPNLSVKISSKLRDEYQNGHTYYPYDGRALRRPLMPDAQPDPRLLEWHNTEVFAA